MTQIGTWIKKNFYLLTWSIDIALFALFLMTFLTGILMFPGFLDLLHVRARDVPYDTIQMIHDWGGLLMGAVILLHLGLHWRATLQFIRNKIFHRTHKQAKVLHIEEVRK